MLFAGFAVADPGGSAAHHHLTLLGIVAAGVLGNLVGSWIAYWRRARRARRAARTPRALAARQAAATSPGPTAGSSATASAAIFFSRMLPIIRTFISLPAGVARMPFGRFTVLTLAGCIPWVLGLGAGRRSGRHEWEKVRKDFEYVDYAIVALVVLGIVYWLVRRRRGTPRAGDRCRPLSAALPAPPRRGAGPAAGPDGAAAGLLLGAHALVPWLAGWPYGELDAELRKSFEVALHTGRGRRARDRHAARAGTRSRGGTARAAPSRCRCAPPALAGLALQRRDRARLGGPRSIAAGLLAGAVAMALGRRASRPAGAAARRYGARDGLALGLAQALALVPGRLAQRRHARGGAGARASRARRRAACRGTRRCPVILGAGGLRGAGLLRRRAGARASAARSRSAPAPPSARRCAAARGRSARAAAAAGCPTRSTGWRSPRSSCGACGAHNRRR